MSSFKDTFTREDKKDNFLDYDDSAFLYFGGTLLVLILIPWWLIFIKRIFFPTNDRKIESGKGLSVRYCECSLCKIVKKKNELKNNFLKKINMIEIIKITILILLTVLFYKLCDTLKDMKAIQTFDPFEILEISRDADHKKIKKAYRLMSLKYHPDKNAHDPFAASRFMFITKAYESLTDEVSKANFEKYGNPDGASFMKVGIGLPTFLIEEQFQILILCVFFIILLVIIPMIFIFYYQKQKKYAGNGVQIQTLQFLTHILTEGTRARHLPELLAASSESREQIIRPTDEEEMKAFINQLDDINKKRMFSLPIIVRNTFLIQGHIQRLDGLLSPHLQTQLQQLLRSCVTIMHSMLEIAVIREWSHTVEGIIEFRRSLIQCLDLKDSSLMQLPYFNQEIVKHCSKGKNQAKELRDFLKQSKEERKGVCALNPEHQADVTAVCEHISQISVKAYIEVEDEENICVGDMATCQVKFTRENLKDDEIQGPIHAPMFPDPIYEEWWIILIDKKNHVIAICRTNSCSKYVEENVKFMVETPGTHHYTLKVMCGTYAGIDLLQDVSYTAYNAEDIKREIFVHPEDEALDNEPTLFQQIMGQEVDDSSDDNSEKAATTPSIARKSTEE